MADGLARAHALKPGSGAVTLGALLTPTYQGVAVGYEHHVFANLNASLAAFAQVQAGLMQGKPDVAAMAGVQVKF